MKKNLLYLFVLTCFVFSCDEGEEAKGITSVTPIDDIKVANGTEFSAIPFPTEVTVTLKDNTTKNLQVTFEQGSYNATTAGTYTIEGTVTVPSGIVNKDNLKPSVNVIVSPLKLKTVKLDNVLQLEYFYDAQDRLDHYTVNTNGTEYTYTYGANNRVTERVRKLAGNLYPEKYFYHNDGKLDRIEFYYGNNVLGKTHTYTYANGMISRFDNSDQSIAGLKFRTFDYSGTDVTKVSFDIGNAWNFTYVADKKVLMPLYLDPANPQDQVTHPVATFTYVQMSSYTTVYVYNAAGYPTQETRTYPGDGNRQEVYTYTYE